MLKHSCGNFLSSNHIREVGHQCWPMRSWLTFAVPIHPKSVQICQSSSSTPENILPKLLKILDESKNTELTKKKKSIFIISLMCMLYHICVGCTEDTIFLMVVRFMIKWLILEFLRNVSCDIELDEWELWCHILSPRRYNKSSLMTISSEAWHRFLNGAGWFYS